MKNRKCLCAADASARKFSSSWLSFKQRHATQRVLPCFGTLDRHLKKQRWEKSRTAPPAGRLLAVEVAAKKSPTQHEPSCGLVVVLSCGAPDRIRIGRSAQENLRGALSERCFSIFTDRVPVMVGCNYGCRPAPVLTFRHER